MSLDQWRSLAFRPGRPGHTKIFPNPWVGEYPTLDDAEWLRTAHRVTAILSLQEARDFVKECRPCVPYMQLLQARYARS